MDIKQRPLKKMPIHDNTNHKSTEDSLLKQINRLSNSPIIRTEDYRPNNTASRDYRDSIDNDARRQQIKHRNTLLYTVVGLAIASFIFLVSIIITQMVIRTFNPNYTGVSDSVINILAVSIFGQVLSVMIGLSYYAWKKK